MALIIDQLKKINQIVAGSGTVDSICAAAVLQRIIGHPVPVVFVQPCKVHHLRPKSWSRKRTVALVNLAVCSQTPSRTATFIKRLKKAKHQLWAVIDEHYAPAWKRILGDEHEHLLIKPVTQGQKSDIYSSCGLLERHVAHWVDEHALSLLRAGVVADEANFEASALATMINAALKSAPAKARQERRLILAGHFAFHQEPSPEIRTWIAAYSTVANNGDEAVRRLQDCGAGIFKLKLRPYKEVDMSAVFTRILSGGVKVLICELPPRLQEPGRLVVATRNGLDLTKLGLPRLSGTRGSPKKIIISLVHQGELLKRLRQRLSR